MMVYILERKKKLFFLYLIDYWRKSYRQISLHLQLFVTRKRDENRNKIWFAGHCVVWIMPREQLFWFVDWNKNTIKRDINTYRKNIQLQYSIARKYFKRRKFEKLISQNFEKWFEFSTTTTILLAFKTSRKFNCLWKSLENRNLWSNNWNFVIYYHVKSAHFSAPRMARMRYL